MRAIQRSTGGKLLSLLLFIATGVPCITAADKNSGSGQIVDSGTFEIFVSGRRVATEKFEIQQGAAFSTATAELQTDDGKAGQRVSLQISSSGDLQKYEWSELGSRSQLSVVPQNEFLVEKIDSGDKQKTVEHPFLLPPSTMVLDDYFFSQREILLWRYLATQCHGGLAGCQLGPTQFGVIVPRQQTSMSVSMEYVGKEKIILRGAQHELSRFKMQVDNVDWVFWADDQLKVQQIVVNPTQPDRVDVLRD